MSYEWQRSSDMPDFTRKGNDVATGGGRLTVLVVVLAVLGGLVLVSSLGYTPAPTDGAETAPAAADGATGTTD